MKIEYDPGLIEAVIFRELAGREAKGDFMLTEEYHSFTDPVYENFPADERPAQFKKIEWDFFVKLGFPKVPQEIFSEFQVFEEKATGGVVVKAQNPFDEGSNLVKGPTDSAGKKRIVVKLLPERFQDVPYLKKLMRHELMHVSDMLDDAFGYRSDRLGCNPMEESIVTERYSCLWDIFVDSRLIRNQRETIADKASRHGDFEVLFRNVPSGAKSSIFEKLWQDEHLTHDRLLELAMDVNKVAAIFEGIPHEEVRKVKKDFLPGSQCPLCQFRTFHWAKDVENDADLVGVIKIDFPNWIPEDGVCERCVESYKVRVPVC